MLKQFIRRIAAAFRSHSKEASLLGAVLLLILCCALSFFAGRRSALDTEKEAAAPKEGSADLHVLATPSFLYKPYATASQAEYADAAVADPEQLTLAYVYPDGADTSLVSESLAGELYQKLAANDAQWMSGIYDLYNYTPQQAAEFLGMGIEAVQGANGVLEEFKDISIQFYDGSGAISQGLSNARDITAICSVLYDYGILGDQEQLEAFSQSLWEASHSYTAQISGVYYCDGGCLDEGISQEEMEEVLLAGEAAESSAAQEAVSSAETGDEAVALTETEEGTVPSSAAEEESTADEAEETKEDVSVSRAAKETEEEVGPGVRAFSESSRSTPSSATPSLTSSLTEAGCPGHVDLTLSVTILGTEGEGNLFEALLLEAEGGTEGGQGSEWTWDEEKIGLVQAVLARDWYEEYGLNTAYLISQNPLSGADIEVYMQLVPKEASQQRRDLVRYALASVGKIPYYWGGKPSRPGYTGNNFGSIVAPDIEGRFLKGLDCSGWINWVYWSATGQSPGAASTSTLLGAGQAVSKEELLPGDICIRTGPEAHVVMFLGWSGDGRMVCIQETSALTNNVEVALVTPDWAAYRRLID